MSNEVKQFVNKDIVISLKNLPPAAYDTMSDYVQFVSAELMRQMGRIKHLLTEDSKITTTYQVSQIDNHDSKIQ